MILLPNVALSETAVGLLAGFQAEIDALSEYADRVQLGKAHFKQRNTTTNRAFQAVKSTLTGMCSGARRCMYCEDSVGDEVEHIRPKDLYPEAVFVWENYLYICGPCNGGKSNRFLVILPDDRIADVTRRRNDPVVPPPAGSRPVFLNPRQEDGLLFMQLDLTGTFRFVPASVAGTIDWERADRTIEILKLNSRAYRVQARKEAFGSYRARLREYAEDRQQGSSAKHLDRLRKALQAMGHPTVWAEMKRQRARLPDLASLFDRVPEALSW